MTTAQRKSSTPSSFSSDPTTFCASDHGASVRSPRADALGHDLSSNVGKFQSAGGVAVGAVLGAMLGAVLLGAVPGLLPENATHFASVASVRSGFPLMGRLYA